VVLNSAIPSATVLLRADTQIVSLLWSTPLTVRIYHLAAVIIPCSCRPFRLRADFCLWAPPDPNSLIGNEEAETVAWCTKPGHGTRIIPGGTLTGVQILKAPAYILVAGTINQANVNIDPSDGGGEMDPHGADEVSARFVCYI